MSEPLLWLGTVVCALAAAIGLLPYGSPRFRVVSLCAAVVVAPILVLGDNWRSEKLEPLADRPELLALIAVAGVVLLLGAGLLLRERLHLLPPLLIAALPFRIPIDLGSGSANLLLPLYVVIAVGLVAALLRREEEEAAPPAGPLRFAAPALAAVVVLYAIQSAYADDPSTAVQNVAFFLAPFAALFHLLASARWDAGALRAIVLVLAAEGVVFAAVAAFQYATGELFWNQKVIEGNEAHQYFRVNSLFWDPNILGRYLAITMIALVALAGRVARAWAAGLFVLLLLVLIASFSQTSMLALIAGLLVLLALRAGVLQGVAAAGLTLLALVASVALIAGGGLSEDVDSGRRGLIDGGLEIAADHPVAGVGSGGFADEFAGRFYEGVGFAVESHTEPVTVLAEQGAIGFIAYVALLLATVGGLIAVVRPRWRAPARGPALACVLCAAYLAMIVHSMGYAAFLSDPLTWSILAIAVGALAVPAAPYAIGTRRGTQGRPAVASAEGT